MLTTKNFLKRKAIYALTALSLLGTGVYAPFQVEAAALPTPQGTISFNQNMIAVQKDQEVTVSVLVSAEDMYDAEIHLEFDPSAIQIVDADSSKTGIQVTPGNLLRTEPHVVVRDLADNSAGTVLYAVSMLQDREGEDANSSTLFSFKVKALKSTGSTKIKWKKVLSENDDLQVYSFGSPSDLTINFSAPPQAGGGGGGGGNPPTTNQPTTQQPTKQPTSVFVKEAPKVVQVTPAAPTVDAKGVASVVVSNAELTKSLVDAAKSENKPVIVKIDLSTPSNTAVSKVTTALEVNTLSAAKDVNANSAVEIVSSFGNISLPVSLVTTKTEAIAKDLGLAPDSEIAKDLANAKVVVDIYPTSVVPALQGQAKIVGTPVDFSITLQTENTSYPLTKSSTYIARSIDLPTEATSTSGVYGVVVDSKGNAYPVPSILTLDALGKAHTVVFKRKGASVYSVMNNFRTFNDVVGHWAQEDIETLASRLIVNGRDDSTFDPASNVTRAETAAILLRSLGVLPESGLVNPFKDLPSDQWYTDYVLTAYHEGLLKGADGSFRPTDKVSREELAIIIDNAFDYANEKIILDEVAIDGEVSKFGDASQLTWSKDAVAKVVSKEIISGDNHGNLNPKAPATRSETVSMLARALRTLQFID